MPRHNLNKSSKSPIFKISFLIFLFLSHRAFAESTKGKAQVLKESKPDSMEIRFSGIEKELQDQKTKMAELESTRLKSVEEKLQAQKSQLSFLETKHDSQIHEIREDISFLKSSLNDRSNVKLKREASGKTEPINNSVKKEQLIKERCTDSSRLCTFFYPDHPDAITTSNNKSFSYNKTMLQVFNSKGTVTTSLNRPPTSCKELKQLGHTLNGFYLVQGTLKQSNKVLTIYCSFIDENKIVERFVGNVELKTKRVHFYVQKNTMMIKNGIIPFEVERLNVGRAMNPASGIFTAPVNGTYHFDFSVLKHDSCEYLVIVLKVNGIDYGRAHTYAGRVTAAASLTASLRLKAWDQVFLDNQFGGLILDEENHLTHFAGWLVDEDLTL